MQIKVDINDTAARKALSGLVAKGDNLRPLMLDIGEEMHRAVEKNFAEGGRPTPWKTTKRAQKDGGKPLTASGRLRRSITVDADNQSVRVGTNVIYGRIHQLGGEIKKGAHSEIFTRNRGSKGRFSKGTQAGRGFTYGAHSIVIPARPFLILPEADQRRLEQIAADFIGGKT